jgi:hypothetical protein
MSTYTFCLIKFQKITLLAFKMSLLRFPRASDRYEELTWRKEVASWPNTFIHLLNKVYLCKQMYNISFEDKFVHAHEVSRGFSDFEDYDVPTIIQYT